MKHATEIKRWADMPEGTSVWTKDINGKWYKTASPVWHKNEIYIVDDEWAELRKAQVDGKQIEFNISVDKWIPVSFIDETSRRSPKDYRVKPEPVYEWQWYYEDVDGYILTSEFYTEEAAKIELDSFEKFKPSKRIRQ